MAGLLASKVRSRLTPFELGPANLEPAPSTRDHAFMTGFALQIFRLQALPKELAAWMIDQGMKV